MRCPMCGTRIEQATQESACKGCALYKLKDGCYLELVLCSSCGYHSLPAELDEANEIPALSIDSIRHTLPDDVVCSSLANLPVGQPARLVEFNGLPSNAVQRLASFGLVPGTLVEVSRCERWGVLVCASFRETRFDATRRSVRAWTWTRYCAVPQCCQCTASAPTAR